MLSKQTHQNLEKRAEREPHRGRRIEPQEMLAQGPLRPPLLAAKIHDADDG